MTTRPSTSTVPAPGPARVDELAERVVERCESDPVEPIAAEVEQAHADERTQPRVLVGVEDGANGGVVAVREEVDVVDDGGGAPAQRPRGREQRADVELVRRQPEGGDRRTEVVHPHLERQLGVAPALQDLV
jgi:hypothetical protein